MRKKDNSFGQLEGYNPILQTFTNVSWPVTAVSNTTSGILSIQSIRFMDCFSSRRTLFLLPALLGDIYNTEQLFPTDGACPTLFL